MGSSARLTSESVVVKEFIFRAGGHQVQIRTRAQLEYQVISAFTDLNRVGKGIINLIVHHVDPIGSLPVSLALRISLHFDKVDTFALSNEELHHLVILLVKRHVDRVVSGSVHAKALNKVEVVAEDLDLGCVAISAGNYKVVCTNNTFIVFTIHLAIDELKIL